MLSHRPQGFVEYFGKLRPIGRDVRLRFRIQSPRPGEPFGAVDVIPAIPPLVAHPPTVDMSVLAWPQTVDRILVFIDVDRTASGTAGANSVMAIHEPDSLAVQELSITQRSDRTEIDDISSKFVGQRKARKNVDFLSMAATYEHQLAGAGDLTAKTDATRTADTPINEERDRFTHRPPAAVERFDVGPSFFTTVPSPWNSAS